MANQRQLFRFRFRWSAPENPPPLRRPTRRSTESKTLAQPTTTRPPNETQTTSPPTQKPPFRHAGIDQPQASPKTESQSKPTSGSATGSQAASPSRAKTTPTLPSAEESHTSSQTQPPSSQTTSPVSSPSRKATQAQPADGAVYLSPSSSDKPQPINQISSQFLSSSTLQSSTSQQESKGKLSQPPLQEPQSKLETTSGTTSSSSSLNSTPKQIPSQTEIRAPNELSKASLPVIAGGPELYLELEIKSKGEERKEILQELPKEEIIKRLPNGEPTQKTITEVVSSEQQVKDAQNVTFEEEETMNGQEKLTSTNHIGRGKMQSSSSSDANLSNVSFQKRVSSNGQQATLQKEMREDIPNLDQNLSSEHQIDGKPVSVVTLTGENRGNVMHLSSEPEKREAPIHIHRAYKINPDDSLETTTDEDVKKSRAERFKEYEKIEALRPRACVNSNVQSVNNSIVFSSSITERDPGVEVIFSHHAAESIKKTGTPEALQKHKAEYTSIPAEKLTHEHTVKRRCLRGLFAESSDSDPDNPAKPRRHGCLYNCKEKRKDIDY